MDKQVVEEKQLIDRYLLNQLTEEEASEFEAYFLSDPECIEQLEIAERLHQGIRDYAVSETIEKQELSEVSRQGTDKEPWWSIKFPVWAMAAIFLVLLIPLTMLNQPTAPVKSFSERPIVVTQINAGLRAIGDAPEMVVSVNRRNVIVLYVDPEILPAGVRTNLFEINQSKAKVNLYRESVQLDEYNQLTVELPQKLKPGEYEVRFLSSGIDTTDFELYSSALKAR